MQIIRTSTANAAAEVAADHVASRAVDAIEENGRFVWAVSGGSTPGVFLAALAQREQVDWERTHLFQVDERIAATDSAERNDTMIRAYNSILGYEFADDLRPSQPFLEKLLGRAESPLGAPNLGG